jgi:hypothetical protein
MNHQARVQIRQATTPVQSIVTEKVSSIRCSTVDVFILTVYPAADGTRALGSQLDVAFLTENMICRSAKATEALQSIIERGMYEFNPLPATDIRQKPILPADYERKLSGATMLIRTAISADYFEKKGFQFYADIHSISVLRRPNTLLSSPIKSPSKKRRFDVPDYVRKAKTCWK